MIFFDQYYLKMTFLSYLANFHLSNVYLSITKDLVDGKLLVVGKLLADGKLLVVSKHLVNIKHLASMKICI